MFVLANFHFLFLDNNFYELNSISKEERGDSNIFLFQTFLPFKNNFFINKMREEVHTSTELMKGPKNNDDMLPFPL